MTMIDEQAPTKGGPDACRGRAGRLLPQRPYAVPSTISGSVWKLTQFT